MTVDWSSSESHLLLNPRMPVEERQRLERLAAMVPPLDAHVWIATSGTSGSLKLAALSKQAVLASALAVNRHLEAGKDDIWCCVLPAFHVGGLAIYARASLTGSRVLSAEWSAGDFIELAGREQVTLTSLVPAQLSDLVRTQVQAPPSLRAIVVGGGAVSDALYDAARALGWPVMPSYGMTEAASQIATATTERRELQLLTHLVARAGADGILEIRGPSLLTGYAQSDGGNQAEFIDPKVDGWFRTGDRGEVMGRELRVAGRDGDFVKIAGESVDLRRLDLLLDEMRGELDAVIVVAADERLGSVIHLASTSSDVDALVKRFNARVFPFERIRRVHRVDSIPRTPLGKLLRAELASRLG